MPAARRPIAWVLLALAGALAGCAYRPGHPVLRGPWGSGAPRAAPAASVGAPGTGDPAEESAPRVARIDEFFGDMGQLRLRLREMRARATTLDQPIARGSEREAAVGLLRRAGGRGLLGGTLRNAVVYGISGTLPLTPERAAALWLDGRAQGRALGIPAFTLEGRAFELPEAIRLAYRAEMRGVGTRPITFDLIFGMWIEGLELPDGTVLLRYDPRPVVGEQHVTFWRGGCILEPDAAGCVVTEVVIFGTDILLPLLESVLRGQVEQALRARGVNLAGFAYQIAGRSAPKER